MMFPMNATIYRASGDPTAPGYVLLRTARVQVVGKSPAAAYERWGIESRRPAELHGLISDWSDVQVNDRVEIDGTIYAVSAPPRIYRVSGVVAPVQHALVLLEQLEHAE